MENQFSKPGCLNSKKIVFVINHAAFFVSHRLPIALAAIERGYEVLLATGRAGSEEMEGQAEQTLKEHGIRHVRVAFTPSGMNPLVESRGLMSLVRLMRQEKAHVVHCASPKGILYGGIAARIARCKALVIAVSGLGFAFTNDPGRGIFRRAAALVFRMLSRIAFGHRNKRVIVQNSEDLKQIVESDLAPAADVELIPGSGVNVVSFGSFRIDKKSKVVLFAARMIMEKGVMDFVEAARRVRRLHPDWQFVMAGVADYESPSSVSAEQLKKFQDEGAIEWLGHVEDMHGLFGTASIVCHPSYYREGLPKTLLEAAAAGCAVVTTDMPGCREACIAGSTADLVPARDPELLANALIGLIVDPQRRETYGQNGRLLARERFSVEYVTGRFMDIYEELLVHCHAASGD